MADSAASNNTMRSERSDSTSSAGSATMPRRVRFLISLACTLCELHVFSKRSTHFLPYRVPVLSSRASKPRSATATPPLWPDGRAFMSSAPRRGSSARCGISMF